MRDGPRVRCLLCFDWCVYSAWTYMPSHNSWAAGTPQSQIPVLTLGQYEPVMTGVHDVRAICETYFDLCAMD